MERKRIYVYETHRTRAKGTVKMAIEKSGNFHRNVRVNSPEIGSDVLRYEDFREDVGESLWVQSPWFFKGPPLSFFSLDTLKL